MLRTSLTLLLLLSAPSVALAQQRVFDVEASEIGSVDLTLSGSSPYVITTAGLSPGGDTVLRLVRLSDRTEVARNDDAFLGSRTSKINYTVPAGQGGAYRIFIVAKAGTPPGSCALAVTTTGAIVFNGGTVFGGTTVDVPVSSVFTPDLYETSLVPGGTIDTLLIAVDNAGLMRGFDDDGNVGRSSRLANVAGVRRVIVGSGTGQSGMTRFLANDAPTQDADHDLLGRLLEEQLGICDAVTSPGCQDVFDPQDSDRDGLSDAIEIFGIADNTNPQLLSRWGADPRRKDLFVEIDFEDTFGVQPLDEAMAEAMGAAFAVAPADQIRNLDHSPGIRLHLDTGRLPLNPANQTLFGDWGGSTPWTVGTPANVMDAIRHDVFVHGHVVVAGGSGGSGWFSATINPNAASPRAAVDTVIHELGHSLMLQHEGGTRYYNGLNCNPLYHSVMSYAAGALGQPDFSDDSQYTGFVLNPSSLCEQAGLGGGDTSHLAAQGMGTFNGVDWNWDGTYDDCSHPVRAAVNWWDRGGCDAHADGSVRLPNRTSPSLAQVGEFMYVFAIDTEGVLVYERGRMSAAYPRGGCPNGFTRGPNQICTEWVGPEIVDLQQFGLGRVTSANVASIDGRVHVAFLHDGNPSEIWTAILSNPRVDGLLQNVSAVEPIVGSKAEQAPELFVLDVDPYLYGQLTRVTMAFWGDAGSGELHSAFRWPGLHDSFLSPNPVEDLAGARIPTNEFSPAAVHWEGGNGVSQSWLAVPNDHDRIRIFQYRAYADRWLDRTADLFPQGAPNAADGKPGFAYRPLLDGNGAIIQPQKGEMQLVHKSGYGQTGVTLEISTVFDDANSGSFKFLAKRRGTYGYAWMSLSAGEHVDFYADPSFPYLKAVTTEGADVIIHPHADGIFDLDFRDVSDFALMERGICVGVHRGNSAGCGPAESYGF